MAFFFSKTFSASLLKIFTNPWTKGGILLKKPYIFFGSSAGKENNFSKLAPDVRMPLAPETIALTPSAHPSSEDVSLGCELLPSSSSRKGYMIKWLYLLSVKSKSKYKTGCLLGKCLGTQASLLSSLNQTQKTWPPCLIFKLRQRRNSVPLPVISRMWEALPCESLRRCNRLEGNADTASYNLSLRHLRSRRNQTPTGLAHDIFLA